MIISSGITMPTSASICPRLFRRRARKLFRRDRYEAHVPGAGSFLIVEETLIWNVPLGFEAKNAGKGRGSHGWKEWSTVIRIRSSAPPGSDVPSVMFWKLNSPSAMVMPGAI